MVAGRLLDRRPVRRVSQSSGAVHSSRLVPPDPAVGESDPRARSLPLPGLPKDLPPFRTPAAEAHCLPALSAAGDSSIDRPELTTRPLTSLFLLPAGPRPTIMIANLLD